MTILSISYKFNTSLIDKKWSNQITINNKLVTTMTTQNKSIQNKVKSYIEVASTLVGPDYDKIFSLVCQEIDWSDYTEDERNMLIFDSFLSVWNLTSDEFDIMVPNLYSMYVGCWNSNESLFEEFMQNLLSQWNYDMTEDGLPCIKLSIDGASCELAGINPLYLYMFYTDVMLPRFGAYSGEIEMSRSIYDAVLSRAFFYPFIIER